MFTDEDLKRLKEKILRSPGGSVFEQKRQWEALLARLEAAENLIEAGQSTCDPTTYSLLQSAWLKSKGTYVPR